MNRTIILVAIAVVALVAIVILSGSLYIVDEAEQVVITQFGKIIGEPVTEPGLHFKTPFVQEARTFPKRLLDWEGDKTVIKTIEQKFIYVEVFARWRISDPKLFLQTVAGRIEIAQSRLDAVIDPVVRDVIAKYTLAELVRSDTGRIIYERVLKGTSTTGEAVEAEEVPEELVTTPVAPAVSEDQPEEVEDIFENIDEQERELFELRASSIQQGRTFITQEIFRKAKEQVDRFGIDIADVRILRINYQPQTRTQVYNRMIAERKRVTARYISEGQQKSAELLGSMDRLLKEIESKAQEQELRTLGEGEATAIATYASAYNADPEFYKFYKTLETLKVTVDATTWLILSTDSELYRVLTRITQR